MLLFISTFQRSEIGSVLNSNDSVVQTLRVLIVTNADVQKYGETHNFQKMRTAMFFEKNNTPRNTFLEKFQLSFTMSFGLIN